MQIILVRIILLLSVYSIVSFADSKKDDSFTLQLSWFDQFQFAGYYIAKEKGFYKDVGLDVKIKPFEFGLDIPKAVSDNKYDFAVGRETLILDKSNDRKIIALYALFQASPLILISTKESGINTINDFNGKRIMTTIDDAGEVSIKSMITSNHVKIKNLNFLQHSHNINDLIEKKTDVISAYSSKAPYHLQKKGVPYNTFSPKDYGFDMYSDLLYTSEFNVDNNLEKVLKFKEASLKGWKYAYKHIDESVDIILKKYNSQKLTKEELLYEAQILKELSYHHTDNLGNIDLHKLRRIYDLYNVMGLVNNQIQIDDFILEDNSFIVFFKNVIDDLSKYIRLHYIYFFILLFSLLVFLSIYKHLKLIEKEKQLLLKNKELLKNKKRLYEVLDASGEGIWDWTFGTNHIKHNDTWYKILGLDKDKDINIKLTTLIHPEDKEYVQEEINKLLTNNTKHYQAEYRLIKRNGETIWIFDKGRIVERDKRGNPLRMAGSFSEITKRKESEIQLAEQHKKLVNSEKMATIGEMIGNIAHQWRQPLSAISTAATGMQVQKEFDILSDETFHKSCNVINDNAQYLSQTIDDFRNFIKGDTQSTQFNLKSNTESFLKLVDSTIKNSHITMVLDLDKDININGYPNELIQCFINIFNNARDALMDNTPEDDRYIFISQEVIHNNIIIRFRDTAMGINLEILDKIFNPYFTTKHQSQGTGLGLHMTHNFIVDIMEGKINANNVSFKYKEQNYKGAEFTIVLPYK